MRLWMTTVQNGHMSAIKVVPAATEEEAKDRAVRDCPQYVKYGSVRGSAFVHADELPTLVGVNGKRYRVVLEEIK